MKRKQLDDSSSSSTMADRSADSSSALWSQCCNYGYKIVNLAEWLDGHPKLHTSTSNNIDAKQTSLPIVDLRPCQQFNQRHLSSTSLAPIVNLPLATLLSGERSCELPPRHVQFAIIIPYRYIDSFVSSHTSCDIHSLFFGTASKTTMQSRKPWLVRQVLLENDEFWMEATRLHLLSDSQANTIIQQHHNATYFYGSDRLWKPDPLVSTNILPLLKEGLQTIVNATNDIEYTNVLQSPSGVILDLGSGAGRDICFLAEELKVFNDTSLIPQSCHLNSRNTSISLPFRFIGIDNHKGSAKRCLPLWKHRGVDDVTQSINLNLNKLNDALDFIKATIPSHEDNSTPLIACIYAIRYLNRKLFAHLAQCNNTATNKSRDKTTSIEQHSSINLPKGTIIAISHFCKPTVSSGWNFDHPKESHVLNRWELRDLFQAKEGYWQTIKDDICFDGDHGRTLIQFMVVKMV